jgi:predicted AlkP superfamily phosphohydrolase/phosphomutase
MFMVVYLAAASMRVLASPCLMSAVAAFRGFQLFCVRAWKVFVAASRLNQLLAEWGFLRFRREPSRGEDVDDVVDWGRSLAVAWGGYYARIFINAVGEDAVEVKQELRRRLSVLKAPWGHIRNVVFEPAELYRAVRGDAPDFMVYFDSLRVRPVQTVGYESPWLEGNDRGPDDSLHSFNGFYAATWGDARRKDIHALDVAGFLERVL